MILCASTSWGDEKTYGSLKGCACCPESFCVQMKLGYGIENIASRRWSQARDTTAQRCEEHSEGKGC